MVTMKHDFDKTIQRYEKALAKGGMVQSYIDTTVIKGIEPYVPFKSGNLSRSAKVSNNKGPGMITWTAPQARYLWYGKSKTGKDLVYNKAGHPLAGKMWTERYKADHMSELKQMIVRKVKSI